MVGLWTLNPWQLTVKELGNGFWLLLLKLLMQQFNCDLMNVRKKSQKVMSTEELKSSAEPTYPNTTLDDSLHYNS